MQGLSQQDQASHHEQGRYVNGDQSSFRLKHALVLSNVATSEVIVEVVAKDFANENTDNRGEVKISQSIIGVPIATRLSWNCEENGSRDIDTDCPSEAEQTGDRG